MINTITILCCVCSLFVSLILPVLILIFYSVKNKEKKTVSAWFLGAAGFFVTQILIRVPLLNLISALDGFAAFAQSHYWLYAFGLALTAGLFELAGRFAVAKIMAKNLTYERALAAGLGHGGIEAIVLVGITYINNLIYIFLINTGAFDVLIAQTAAAGADTSQLVYIRDVLLDTPGYLYLLGGLERLLTMICHAAMSMIVCFAVHKKRVLPGLLSCLSLHTLLDTTAGISGLATDALGNRLSQTAAYTIIYFPLTAFAVLSVLILRRIRIRWQNEVTPNGGTL